jgi:hypothetical protein
MERRGDEPDQGPQEDTQEIEAPADGPDPADQGETSQDEPASE